MDLNFHWEECQKKFVVIFNLPKIIGTTCWEAVRTTGPLGLSCSHQFILWALDQLNRAAAIDDSEALSRIPAPQTLP
jgi:hypothetical protein